MLEKKLELLHIQKQSSPVKKLDAGNLNSKKSKSFGITCRREAESSRTLLSLSITVTYLRRYAITFVYTKERWFKQELVGADIPCWPNYYSLLRCHIWSSSEPTGLSHQVIEMNTGLLYEVDNQGLCHEPHDQEMADKCLHQSLWWRISVSKSFWFPAFWGTMRWQQLEIYLCSVVGI